MGDMLSQEEINELLKSQTSSQEDKAEDASDTTEESTSADDAEILSEFESDTLGEVGNISMGSAATVLHNLLSRRVVITTPVVSVTDYKKLVERYSVPYVAIHVSYVEGLIGDNILIIKTEDVKAITSLLLNDENYDKSGELTEIDLSAISEVMNQMMGSSSTAMSKLVNKKINISPPRADIVNFKEDNGKIIEGKTDVKLISIAFSMEIENLFDTEIVLLMDVQFGKDIVQGFLDQANAPSEKKAAPAPAPAPAAPPVQAQAPMQAPAQPQPMYQEPPRQAAPAAPPVNVRPIQFESFNPTANNMNVENIEMLFDVPLRVTVELGQTKMLLKDILDLNSGSIVTLDKLAGELVDVVVNGKTIAKGEVVVADENFAVRITDIIKSNKNVSALNYGGI